MSLSVDKYEEVADKDDLMGVEDTAKKGFFSKPSLKSRNTIFTLGQRGAVLSPAELEGPILIPHTAQRGDCRYPYETLFRSQHYALLDNGCREFLFLSDFFMVAGNSALELFNSVMGKTLSLFLKSMSTYVSDCYDSIAVFLCIHIILRFRAITTKRAIPALDKYWEAVLELLWPRFELILEMNIQSIRNTDPRNWACCTPDHTISHVDTQSSLLPLLALTRHSPASEPTPSLVNCRLKWRTLS